MGKADELIEAIKMDAYTKGLTDGRKAEREEWLTFGRDRRSNTPAPKTTTLERRQVHANAKRTCPIRGCKSAFAPRFGGFCDKHRNTEAFKKWQGGTRQKQARKK